VPKDAVSGVRAPLAGYASLTQNNLHDFQSILYEVVGGKLRKFYYTATLQQANFITRLFTRYIDELKLLSAIRALRLFFEAHNLKQQSSESRKIRGEADAIST
jgi:hypothetical protein